MRTRALILFLAATALAGPGVATGWAQSKTGTTFGQFLLIEPSARIAGVGNAGVAIGDGIESVYYNPAAIGRLGDKVQAQFSHAEWFAGITYDYIATAVPAGKWGNLFASITALNSGDIDVRTVSQPLGTGDKYNVSDLAIGLGYGHEFSGRFSAGAQITWLQETIWHSSANAGVFNVGMLYRTSVHGLYIGGSVNNFGTDARFDGADLRVTFDADPNRNGDNGTLPAVQFTDAFALPVIFRVGIGCPWKIADDQVLRLEADAFHPSDNDESVSLGAEWTYRDLLALRGGWQNLFLTDTEVGLTLGAGLATRIQGTRVRFDYAWADQGRLGSSQRFSLGAMF
jgi:hypothetical protein